jgi:hypothetical protein
LLNPHPPAPHHSYPQHQQQQQQPYQQQLQQQQQHGQVHAERPWTPGHEEAYRNNEEPKEKKKFWGVAWGDKREKHKEKDRERDRDRDRELTRPVMGLEDRRPSNEGWRENESVGHGSTGHHSHHSHSQSQNHSNYTGQHIQMSQVGHHDGYTGIEMAENVTQAIGTLRHIFKRAMTDVRYPGSGS